MRTVHETEALRPSDPVPKHHSSNPSNKFQRLRLVLSTSQKLEKSSTPASPSSHAPNSALIPLTSDAEYANNNAVYVQDISSPNATTMLQLPEDMNFSDHELSLPAPELFRLLRRQMLWATQEGEQLRADAELLEKQRKDEWVAKELLIENLMEAEHAKSKRKRIDAGLDDLDSFSRMEEDLAPAKVLKIASNENKEPWWREEAWVAKLAEVHEPKQKTIETVEPAPEVVPSEAIAEDVPTQEGEES